MNRTVLVLAFVAVVAARPAVIDAGQALRSAPATGVRVVDFEQLKTFLPVIAGWTQSDTRGEQLTLPAICARTETRYKKDDGHVELEILDTATSQLLLAPLAMFASPGFSERTDDGFRRAIRLGGQPASEEWNVKTGRGEVTAIVGNRYVVTAIGHHVADVDAVRRIVEAVDLARLAALR
jgi:hypothetical protein